jgi:hypothetical protein
MPDKKENAKSNNITASSGLSGKTITAVHAWEVGSVDIVEIVTASGSTFIKWKAGRCDVGGDASFGSGTVLF